MKKIFTLLTLTFVPFCRSNEMKIYATKVKKTKSISQVVREIILHSTTTVQARQ